MFLDGYALLHGFPGTSSLAEPLLCRSGPVMRCNNFCAPKKTKDNVKLLLSDIKLKKNIAKQIWSQIIIFLHPPYFSECVASFEICDAARYKDEMGQQRKS